MKEHLTKWFRGNQDAVMYALCLWEACQEWDDLEDEGKANHNALLSWLAFGRDENGFYRAHSHLLRPAALMVYLQWTAANVLDHGDKNDVAKSYMLRAAIYSNFHLIAWICGGDDWARQVGPEIYRLYGETPEGLWKEMNDA